jgi:YhgE/Pip-like protein
MAWLQAVREVLRYEWLLLQRHRKLAAAAVGLLFVPALYALIYLWSMWDPTSHTNELPVGLVNLDTGAQYTGRDLNLGTDVLAAIEQHGLFHYQRFSDREEARRLVRRGDLAFTLEVPADFSRRALPGEAPGAAKLTLYTSEGNNYSSAGFARRFAPEVAQRVNTMLGEARWELVLSSAAGSKRSLDTLRTALADLHQGTAELQAGLKKAGEGQGTLLDGSQRANEGAGRLRTGAQQLAEQAPQLSSGLRQVAPLLRGIDARRPPDADLAALRQGTRQLSEGQRELGRGLDALAAGGRQIGGGLGQLKTAADDIPIFGGSIVEGVVPLEDGTRQLVAGLDTAREGNERLLAASLRIDEAVLERLLAAVQEISLKTPGPGRRRRAIVEHAPAAIRPAQQVHRIEMQHRLDRRHAVAPAGAQESGIGEDHFGRKDAVGQQALRPVQVAQHRIQQRRALRDAGLERGEFRRRQHQRQRVAAPGRLALRSRQDAGHPLILEGAVQPPGALAQHPLPHAAHQAEQAAPMRAHAAPAIDHFVEWRDGARVSHDASGRGCRAVRGRAAARAAPFARVCGRRAARGSGGAPRPRWH